MRVAFERHSTLDGIFGDPDFAPVFVELARSRKARIFFTSVVRRVNVRLDGPQGLEMHARLFVAVEPAHGTDRQAVEEAARLLTRLYRRHDEGNLRGALLEGFLRFRLAVRYAPPASLNDNVVVIVSNGVTYRTPTTIDVVGWDGRVGECHDCKVRAKSVNFGLIQSLERDLPQEFRIGIVTVESRLAAAGRFHALGFRPRRATILSAEDLWEFAPLQQPAA